MTPAIALAISRDLFGGFFDFSSAIAARKHASRSTFARTQSYASIRRLMVGRTRGTTRRWAWILAAVSSLAGCSAVIDADKAKLGPSPVPCEPGQSVPCPCRDGSTSTQKCNALARFDACMCAATAGRGGTGSSTSGLGTAAGRAASGGSRLPR